MPLRSDAYKHVHTESDFDAVAVRYSLGKAVLIGSNFEPFILEHLTWSQIAAALGHPVSVVGQAIPAHRGPAG